MSKEGEFIKHTACPHCGSSDANAMYTDGNRYCFSCRTLSKPDTNEEAMAKFETHDTVFLDVEFKELTKRGLTQRTCEFWGYGISEYRGQKVQVANYRGRDGELKAQKVRFPSKDFSVIGSLKEVSLYGEHLWRDGNGEQFITICEGEIDAMSVSQAFDNKWPVVSLPSGCTSAKKAISKSIEWLSKYDYVVLMFDMDEAGQRAAKECASVLPPNKCRIAKLPLKDANEMLQARRVKELINSVWEARTFRPDGIISGTEVWDIITQDDQRDSVPYHYTGLQDKTGGCRMGEIVTLTAGSGIGKSQLAREFAHNLIRHGKTLGYIALEESVKRTALGLMSIEMNKPLHLQSKDVPEEELRNAFNATLGTGRVYLYDHWGSTDSDNLLDKIRYLVHGCGCDYIILDHISIVVSGLEGGDERRLIDNTMTRLRTLVEELNCGMILVSHLKRPSGDRGHEDGAQTSLAQLRGSAAIGQLSDMVIGLERDQQDKDNPHVSHVRVLKNRWSGETGLCCSLEYSTETGRMVETIFNDEEDDIDF